MGKSTGSLGKLGGVEMEAGRIFVDTLFRTMFQLPRAWVLQAVKLGMGNHPCPLRAR